MAVLSRYLIVAFLASTTIAQTSIAVTSDIANITSSVSSVISSASSVVSSIVSSASSELSSASSVASSLASAASSAASVGSSSAASSLSSAASVASSSASSVSSSVESVASSVSSSIQSSVSSVVSSASPTKTSSTKSQTYTYTSVSSSVVLQSTVYSTSAVIVTTQPNGQTSQLTEYTVVQTTIPATTLFSTTLVTSTESPTGIAGLQSDGLSGSGSGGLSTGAKAGIGAGVGVAVVVAAILGALYAMRRRRRNDRVADHDRYTPSVGGSFMGGLGKQQSHYTESEMRGPNSPPMREANPLERYAVPGGVIASQGRGTIPPTSRTSDISSMSGSEPTTFRPGPGMPVVAEQQQQPHQHHYANVEEMEDNPRHNPQDYLAPGAAYGGGNPFHEKSGGDTPSMYSEEGDGPSNSGPQHHPSVRQASPAALELSGENTLIGSTSGASQGYRGMDPEQPYHTRALQKPMNPQRQYDPSHNF